MDPKLKELIAKLAAQLAKPPDQRDEAAVKAALTGIDEFAKSDEGKGYTASDELAQQVAQIRKDLDTQAESFRRLERAGLQADGQRVKLLGHDEIMDLRRVGRVFPYKDQAESFGAMAAHSIWHKHPAYKDIVHSRTRDMAESLVKQLDPGASGSGAELVANLYMANLIAHVEAVGVLFTQCDRVPLQTTGQTTWPRLTGEMTAYPLAALAKFIESAMTLDTVTLTPVKWGTLGPIPNEFFRNPTLLDQLGQRVGWMSTRAIAYAFDNALVNGDGTADYGTITGILQDANITAITAAAAATIGAYTGAEVGAVIAGISKDYVGDPRWMFHLSSERTLRNIRSTVGTPLYERGGNGEPNTIDNYPYSVCQRFPAAGGVGASTKWGAFGQLQLSHYFGMLTNIGFAASEHVRFEYDVTVVRGMAEVDAALKDGNAIVTAKTHA